MRRLAASHRLVERSSSLSPARSPEQVSACKVLLTTKKPALIYLSSYSRHLPLDSPLPHPLLASFLCVARYFKGDR